MRESRPYGSERGAFSNGRPYRDRTDGPSRALGDLKLLLSSPGNAHNLLSARARAEIGHQVLIDAMGVCDDAARGGPTEHLGHASSRTRFRLNGTVCGKPSASAASKGPYGSGRLPWQSRTTSRGGSRLMQMIIRFDGTHRPSHRGSAKVMSWSLTFGERMELPPTAKVTYSRPL